MGRILRAAALAGGLLACDGPPRGEALIVVDTDMPIPKIVSHLRVDVYSGDGSKWLASRDIEQGDARQWPLSFSVYDQSGSGSSALVRLRAYPSGYIQDYAGEGYLPLPPLGATWTSDTFKQCCSADCMSMCPQYWSAQPGCTSHCPQLEGGGTPATEPQPLVTIDRLVRVDLVTGVRGKVSVLLAGACAGTQAVLPDPTRSNPSPSDFQTCVDTERTLVPVASATLDPDMSLPLLGTSVQGQFEKPFAADCTSQPRAPRPGLYDDEVCVRGGVMVLGDEHGLAATGIGVQPRIAAVPSFLMDKYEYSVARLGDAVAKGYGGLGLYILVNDGPLGDPTQPEYANAQCSAYDQAGFQSPDRDAAALNCVRWDAARALCQLEGGDLPLEVQWEYAVSQAGRTHKDFVTFPNPPVPQCQDVAYARGNSVTVDDQCARYMTMGSIFGVARVDYGNDVAPPGLIGMTGNLIEHVRDAATPMVANCWLSAPLTSPSCVLDAADNHILRGGSWVSIPRAITAAQRWTLSEAPATNGGFRCVR